MPMQPARPSTSRYILTALCVLVVVTALVLVALNAFMQQRNGNGFLSQMSLTPGQGYAKGYQDAREKMAKLCPALSENATSFVGTVVSVSADAIAVKQENLPVDENVDGVSDIRTVTLAQGAQVVMVQEKDSETYRKELAAYKPVAPKPGELPVSPPLPSTEKQVSLSQLQEGQRVVVVASTDVRFSESIEATLVKVIR